MSDKGNKGYFFFMDRLAFGVDDGGGVDGELWALALHSRYTATADDSFSAAWLAIEQANQETGDKAHSFTMKWKNQDVLVVVIIPKEMPDSISLDGILADCKQAVDNDLALEMLSNMFGNGGGFSAN